mgnify:CR=1 FL=1
MEKYEVQVQTNEGELHMRFASLDEAYACYRSYIGVSSEVGLYDLEHSEILCTWMS